MANEWNTSYPLDHTKIGDVPGEIRKLKSSTKTQLDREHETPVDGDATGAEHSNGSAVAYVGSDTPANRPDGATALADNEIDQGRLWLDEGIATAPIKRWDGSAWVHPGFAPNTGYAGGESITFPNGLIVKQGVKSCTFTTSPTNNAVAFAEAFPTGMVRGFVSLATDSIFNISQNISVVNPTAAGFNIRTYSNNAFSANVNWIAIGY